MTKKIKSNPAKTILTISIGFILVFYITKNDFFLTISFCLGIIGITSNYLSLIIEKIWFKIAEILSLIIPNILLGVIFYLFLFPISIVQKMLTKNNSLKLKNLNTSTYVDKNQKFDKKSFINPW